MKKEFIHIFIVVVAAMCLYSCSPDNNIETKTYQFNQKYYLTQDTTKGILTVDIRVELPEKYLDKTILMSVRNDIVEKSFGKDYIQYSNNKILSRYASDMAEEYKDNNLPFFKSEDPDEIGFAYNNDYILEIFSLLNNEHFFSYGLDLYVYMGGAHGVNNRLYYNYDLRNGRLISEEDLFWGDYKPFLTELIKQQIVDYNAEINSIEDLNNIYWTEYIKPNGNFYITDDAINYVFNQYEIAPYAYGHTEVSIPFAKIKDILKENTPIECLLQK